MNEWMRVLLYAFITLFLGLILRELGFGGTRLILLLGTVSLIGASVVGIGGIIADIPGLAEVGEEYTSTILKIVGVGYVFGICSDVCAELGEVSLCNAVCLFGRIEILTLVMPFIKRIVEKGIELI